MTGSAEIALTSARRLHRVLSGLGALAIAACGGGAATTDNPIRNVNPPPIYSGPPPVTADVQAFKLNVWDNLQATNRCGSCHTDTGGQTPMFVRRDDINLAYQAANTVADLNQPASSRLVTKVDDP
ncbi:MAG: hypothetical protein ACE5OQ_03145, partial [Woeseia sp.]